MDNLTFKDVQAYSSGIRKITQAHAGLLSEKLSSIDYSNVARARNQAIEIVQAITTSSTESTATLSSEFYTRARAGSNIKDAYHPSVSSSYNPKKTEGKIRNNIKAFTKVPKKAQKDPKLYEEWYTNKVEEFVHSMTSHMDTMNRLEAFSTIAKNAQKDPARPRFARVPCGAETCKFCIMLASRGFVYHSQTTASHAHANCDCVAVPNFKNSNHLLGYDPNAYYKIYLGMEKTKVDIRKLENYSLDANHINNKGKARGWKTHLDLEPGDGQYILKQVYEYLGVHEPVKTPGGNPLKYQSDIPITGKNGNTENVRVGWMKEDEKYKMTTIFVKPLK